MSTQINLKSAAELYKIAPDLAIIAERLENSVNNIIAENERLKTENRKNKETPGSRTFKPRYPEHYRVTEVFKEGRWEKIPTELKSGKEAFERDITTIASTRDPQALKISIYSGKANRNTSAPEVYTIYLTTDAKAEVTEKAALGTPEDNTAIKQLQEQFVALSQAKGSPQSVELLQANFAKQLSDFQHKAEINELKREHERALEKKDDRIADLEDEIEELEEQLAESDGALSGAADQINAKMKPPAMQEMAISILTGVAKQFAIENPKYLSAVTNKTPEEIKAMLVDDAEAFETKAPAKIENTGASFSEAAPVGDANEYAGYSEESTRLLKQLHTFAKSLSPADLVTFYNICAYCCLPSGDIDLEHANMLTDLINPKK